MAGFFLGELEGVATYWRIYRRDGVALAFTSHDRDISFDGIAHRAAPGMLPAAIRKSIELSPDDAEVEGVLSHDSIAESDLDAGLYDDAQVEIGAVNWETLARQSLYSGTLGTVERQGNGFTAQLRSAKARLERDLVPRSGPICRAQFCGPECGLSRQKFLHRSVITGISLDQNYVTAEIGGADFLNGRLRFLGGPQAGLEFGILAVDGPRLFLDRPLVAGVTPGITAELLEGCDQTLQTCRARFANVVNFRAEPYLPGNDLLARYGSSR